MAKDDYPRLDSRARPIHKLAAAEAEERDPSKRKKVFVATANDKIATKDYVIEFLGSDAGRCHTQRIKRKIWRKLPDKSRREDVYQEVLLATIENAQKGNIFRSGLEAYMYAISRNILSREYTKAQTRWKLEVPISYETYVNPETNKGYNKPLADTATANPELTALLNKAFRSLTEKEQRVIYLKEQCGFEYKEIAEELHVTQTNAKVIRHRAALAMVQYLRSNIWLECSTKKPRRKNSLVK